MATPKVKNVKKNTVKNKGSVAKKTPAKKTIPVESKQLAAVVIPIKLKIRVLYIDSSFFFPPGNGAYTDHLQEGRVSVNGMLIAPLMLQVGSVIKSITIYYKNNTQEELTVWILKYHIDHHAYSGEVEVSYEPCPPGILAPDNFLQHSFSHFDAAGKILDKYMYHIEIGSTIKTASEERILRGIRIAYTEPA